MNIEEQALALSPEDVAVLVLWEDYSEWMSARWIAVPPRTNSLEDYLREGRDIDVCDWPGDRDPNELSMMLEDLDEVRAHVALARSRVGADGD